MIVEFVEGGNLPPERWSGVAAEDQHDRLMGGERGKLDAGAFVEFEEVEVGGGVAGMKRSGAGSEPRGLEGENEKGDRARHARHDPAEGFGRLTHGPEDTSGKGQVEDHQDSQRAENEFFGKPHPHGFHMVQAGEAGWL
jgi:hypothetical protein